MTAEALRPILEALVVKSSLPLKAVETSFVPDSSGFSTGRFVRWYDEKYGVTRSGKDWVKVHIMCGTKTHVIAAIRIEGRNAADCLQFVPLLATTAENFEVKEVPADKAYLPVENVEAVAALGGTAFIPPKTSTTGGAGGLFEKLFRYYQFRRDDFLKHYHARSNVESTFSAIKRKFGDSVMSKTDTAMANEVLCKLLCHNLTCLIQEQETLGIVPIFRKDEDRLVGPAILPMTQAQRI